MRAAQRAHVGNRDSPPAFTPAIALGHSGFLGIPEILVVSIALTRLNIRVLKGRETCFWCLERPGSSSHIWMRQKLLHPHERNRAVCERSSPKVSRDGSHVLYLGLMGRRFLRWLLGTHRETKEPAGPRGR